MTWGVATALLEQGGNEGLFEVDEAWLPRVAAELNPSLIVLGNLFRDQLDRYGELEHLADEWAEVVASRAGRPGSRLNADDPLVADLGRDRELSGGRVSPTSGSRTEAGAGRASTRVRRQALPPLRRAVRVREGVRRALGHYRCPSCGADRPSRTWPRPGSSCDGMRGSRVSVAGGHRRGRARPPPPGPLQRLQRAGGADRGRRGWESGSRTPRRASSRCRPCSAASRRSRSARRAVSILLIKNPAGANEVLRTLLLEAERRPSPGSTCGSRSTTESPTDATSRGSGTPTSSCSRVACGRIVCAGTRAPEMAVRLKYAGVPDAALTVDESIERSLDARSPRRTAAVRPSHLHGPARASRSARPAWPGATSYWE